MAHQCESYKIRVHHDVKPDSLMGCFWRWHIDLCPEWKVYFTSATPEKQAELREKYHFAKYANQEYKK